MSKPQKIKQGYMKKCAKSIVGESWKKVFVEIDKNGTFYWYKKKSDSNPSRSVSLTRVCEFLTVGSYCRAIPFSPQLPSGGRLENMIAFPEEPNKKSKIHFFLCDSEQEFNEWMSAITSILPARQESVGNQSTLPYSAYSPPINSQFPATSQAATNLPPLGFEGLSISSNPPPYSNMPQTGYAPPPPQPYPQQPYYPYPQQVNPQQPPYNPQQPYQPPYNPASQGYAQQPYQRPSYPPQQPSYPPQQPSYPPQQPSYPPQQPSYPPQQPSYPPQQGYPQQPYYNAGARPQVQPGLPPGHVTYVQQPAQTIVVRDRHHSSPGMGNVAAGVLGGAVAGYAASRMFGGWGYGYGWGPGSWGSCSWGSGSWSSCSGGSWGSFGSFD